MPTYDYVCDACEHKFELFQSITDKPQKKCPKCGKLKLRRLFGTGAAVMFKGSGFYTTDYRSDSYKKQASADKPSDAKSTDGGSPSGGSSTGASSSGASSSGDSSSGSSSQSSSSSGSNDKPAKKDKKK